ncbi:hypothetical protein MRX96_050582 [Rhipicephalus microplus]
MVNIREFDAILENGNKNSALYVEIFEHYCQNFNVQEEKLMKPAFITINGKNVCKTLKDLLLPGTPAEKSLVFLIKVLCEYYEAARRIIAERVRFNTWY